MGRRRNNILQPETLSQESDTVKNELLKDIIKDDVGNEVEQGSINNNDMNNLSNNETKKTVEKPGKDNGEIFTVGEHVKLKKDVKFDLLGRRIHPGLRNYNYRILSIRLDGMIIIECLTHCFTVKPTDIEKP